MKEMIKDKKTKTILKMTEKYVCKDCGRSYKQQSSLQRHKRKTHSGQLKKPHQCTSCPASFHSRYQLSVHNRIHTNERPYACHLCPSRFRQNSHLLTHIRTHTKEKPYGCKVCGKRFTQSSSVTTHMRIHSDIKPFACPHCFQQFTQKHSRDRHVIAKHTGDSCTRKRFTKKQHIKACRPSSKRHASPAQPAIKPTSAPPIIMIQPPSLSLKTAIPPKPAPTTTTTSLKGDILASKEDSLTTQISEATPAVPLDIEFPATLDGIDWTVLSHDTLQPINDLISSLADHADPVDLTTGNEWYSGVDWKALMDRILGNNAYFPVDLVSTEGVEGNQGIDEDPLLPSTTTIATAASCVTPVAVPMSPSMLLCNRTSNDPQQHMIDSPCGRWLSAIDVAQPDDSDLLRNLRDLPALERVDDSQLEREFLLENLDRSVDEQYFEFIPEETQRVPIDVDDERQNDEEDSALSLLDKLRRRQVKTERSAVVNDIFGDKENAGSGGVGGMSRGLPSRNDTYQGQNTGSASGSRMSSGGSRWRARGRSETGESYGGDSYGYCEYGMQQRRLSESSWGSALLGVDLFGMEALSLEGSAAAAGMAQARIKSMFMEDEIRYPLRELVGFDNGARKYAGVHERRVLSMGSTPVTVELLGASNGAVAAMDGKQQSEMVNVSIECYEKDKLDKDKSDKEDKDDEDSADEVDFVMRRRGNMGGSKRVTTKSRFC